MSKEATTRAGAVLPSMNGVPRSRAPIEPPTAPTQNADMPPDETVQTAQQWAISTTLLLTEIPHTSVRSAFTWPSSSVLSNPSCASCRGNVRQSTTCFTSTAYIGRHVRKVNLPLHHDAQITGCE
jgi:hypothetical protein